MDDSGGTQPYQRIDELNWATEELQLLQARQEPWLSKDKKVKLFRVTVSTTAPGRASSPTTSLKIRRMRYKMRTAYVGKLRSFTAFLKQLTGVEACQCRKARIQRNHVACALLVCSRLKTSAYQAGKTIYQIKHGMLSDYLSEQLKNPSVQMALA